MNTHLTVGERIKQRRKQLHITADYLAEQLGVSRSTIFRYEKGDIEKVPTVILEEVARVLQTTPAYLMGWADGEGDITTIYNRLNGDRQEKVYDFARYQLDEQENHKRHANGQSNKAVPMVGETAANPTELTYGDPIYDRNVEVNVPQKADCALVVKGDSMEPAYHDGDIVFYKSQPMVENGEMAIVEIDGSGVTLKKVYFDYANNKVILKSLNDKYKNRELSSADVRILGKVVK